MRRVKAKLWALTWSIGRGPWSRPLASKMSPKDSTMKSSRTRCTLSRTVRSRLRTRGTRRSRTTTASPSTQLRWSRTPVKTEASREMDSRSRPSKTSNLFTNSALLMWSAWFLTSSQLRRFKRVTGKWETSRRWWLGTSQMFPFLWLSGVTPATQTCSGRDSLLRSEAVVFLTTKEKAWMQADPQMTSLWIWSMPGRWPSPDSAKRRQPRKWSQKCGLWAGKSAKGALKSQPLPLRKHRVWPGRTQKSQTDPKRATTP